MIVRTWGAFALSALLGFALVGVDDALAARSVASSEQVKKKIRPAPQAAMKKRVSVAATASLRNVAPTVSTQVVFRPPKAPAQRHYAVDGSTFYADGVRIRAAGLEALEMRTASSIGKQKLQQLLDSGRVSIEPLDLDDGDVTVARVRIDGRDLSELAGMH